MTCFVCGYACCAAKGDEIMSKVKKNRFSIKVVMPAEVETVLTPSDIEMDIRALEAFKAAILKAEICKKPVAKYDMESKRAYLQYPDGIKEYV